MVKGIYIDYPVWKKYFSGSLSEKAKNTVIDYINNYDVYYDGIVYSQLLDSAQDVDTVNRISEILAPFTFIECTQDDYLRAKEMKVEMMGKEVPFSIDKCTLFSVCLRKSLLLLTEDENYKKINSEKIISIEFLR